MGILFLVRHAQASFLGEKYDKLSTLGEGQARLLGEYWARRNIVFDRACVRSMCPPAGNHHARERCLPRSRR